MRTKGLTSFIVALIAATPLVGAAACRPVNTYHYELSGTWGKGSGEVNRISVDWRVGDDYGREDAQGSWYQLTTNPQNVPVDLVVHGDGPMNCRIRLTQPDGMTRTVTDDGVNEAHCRIDDVPR